MPCNNDLGNLAFKHFQTPAPNRLNALTIDEKRRVMILGGLRRPRPDKRRELEKW
jgi:hypothetical protein